mgnify:CR=1 FL=1
MRREHGDKPRVAGLKPAADITGSALRHSVIESLRRLPVMSAGHFNGQYKSGSDFTHHRLPAPADLRAHQFEQPAHQGSILRIETGGENSGVALAGPEVRHGRLQ